MRTLYLDCFAGISGDMLLGALIDSGVPVRDLAKRLKTLGLRDYRLSAKKTSKNGISGTKAEVTLCNKSAAERHGRKHQGLPGILSLIGESRLPAAIKEKSAEVFSNLASAEAKVHGIPPEQVHFHEVGAADAIIDIVGTITALDMLGVEQVICSPLPLGRGFAECAHGILPLPAPAVLELLGGIPTKACDNEGETVTPTGAALVKTLAAGFGPIPPMKILSTGYGAGTADRPVPNLLRAILGEAADSIVGTASRKGPYTPWGYEEDSVAVAEVNIDDMNPEFFDYIIPLLSGAGALDVFLTPVIMKKGRPAQVLTCLAAEENLGGIINILLTETTTLGVRTYFSRRYKLSRETIKVATPYGDIAVKLGRHPATGQALNVAPEWEDCRAAAKKSRVPVKTVDDAAKAEGYNTAFNRTPANKKPPRN